jgi:hypothetical protein
MTGKKTTKIDLGGKERTFYFGLGFLGLFIEKTGISLGGMQDYIKSNPFKAIPEMMFYSLAYGFARQDLKPDFNVYLVTEWIDEDGGADGPGVMAFMESFNKSMSVDLPASAEPVKKKRAQARKIARKSQ